MAENSMLRQIAILRGKDNFPDWKRRMGLFFQTKRYTDIISGTTTRPTHAPSGGESLSTLQEDWDVKNADALLAINVACSDDALANLQDITDAAAA